MLGHGALSESALSAIPQWNPERTLREPPQRVISRDEFRADQKILLVDPRLLEYFDSHPDEIFALGPWEFQEFVAELLKRFGYAVQLGPRGPDGGVDVFAERNFDTGRELVLVQCKRNSLENKVSKPVVKLLFADVETRQASRGLVVTTSTFTKPALEFIRQWHYRLAGVDNSELMKWIRQLEGQ